MVTSMQLQNTLISEIFLDALVLTGHSFVVLLLSFSASPVLSAAEITTNTSGDIVKIPLGRQIEGIKDLKLPDRGAHMETVASLFGNPAEVFPAVGLPPITKWVYESFSVYFEHQHVIHAVFHHKEPQLNEPQM